MPDLLPRISIEALEVSTKSGELQVVVITFIITSEPRAACYGERHGSTPVWEFGWRHDPKAMLERMNVNNGDRLYLVETERGLLLTPYDPRFEAAMAAYAEGAALFRNALKKLAK